MILQSIQLTTYDPQAVAYSPLATFNFATASNTLSTDRYIITNITGLDVAEVSPRVYGAGLVTGANFTNMKMAPREVVMRVFLNPNYSAGETPESLRAAFYKMIASYRISETFISIFTTLGTYRLRGFLTKVETDLFTSASEVQLTFRCIYPMIRKANRTALTITSTPAATITVTVNDTLSTAPHGFIMVLTYTTAQTSFVMQKPSGTTTDWKFQVNRNFFVGDVLTFCSEDDAKALYVATNNGVVGGPITTVQLGANIVAGSTWPVIYPGSNQYQLSYGTWAWTKFEHYETHWGI